jgi:putative phage-type endonuclease
VRDHRYADREEWLAARRKGLGGSDVPAVLGLSPWRTPLQVWAEKVGIEGGEELDSYPLRRGSHMEGLLWEELAIDVPAATEALPQHFVIVEGAEPWMLYSPDAFISEYLAPGQYRQVLGEAKSHPKGASDWDEGPPPHVLAQVQWGMHVCDLPACYVVVDLGTEFKWAKVERDTAWAEANVPILRAFWNMVLSETPPAPTGDEGDRDVLQRLWTRPQEGKTVALSDKLLELSWEYDEISAQQLSGKKRLEEIKAEIEFAMKDAEFGMLPDGSAFTWKTEGQAARPQPAWSKRVLRRKKAKER